jgi:dimethylaniline monooxygenase (N-oxide forming)
MFIGWNGLIAAQTYLKLAPETSLLIVDDGESIGGTWSKEKIYPSLFAQISHPLFEYSFYPMKRKDISPDGYIPGSSIHEYLASFADEYGLTPRTRLRTKVVCVTRASDMSWIVELDEGPTLHCAKLIYATGPTSSKVIPTWPQKGFEKPIVHSQGIGEYQDLIHSSSVDRATVVGAAKSAFDLVFMLLKAGKKVDWVMRKSASGPLSISAPTFINLWNTVDHVSTRMAASFSPSIMNTSGFWYYFLQRTMFGRALTSIYWWVSTFLSAQHAGYGANDDFEKLRPHPYSYG